MPIDAGAIGIRPVTQQRPTGGVDSVQRRDDGSSSGGGFRPQTNVALKTAIEDLSNALSKISSQEKFGINKLPQEVGEIVRNILQQSFSMEETLSQGIGSTIESQRFSMEQLTVFSRMLLQIGALADKGFSMQLSDETQLLLSKFKDLLVSEEGGNSLEPVLLSKAAFELIDSKTAEQLPQALYEILAQLAQQLPTMQTNQPQQSEGMQFLNQLIRYFMPRPSTSDKATSEEQTQQPRQEQTQQGQSQPQTARQGQWQQAMRQSATQQFLQSMFRQLGGNKTGNAPQGQQPTNPNQAQNFSNQPTNPNQAQNFSNQPTNQNQAQNFSQQPTNPNQAQNFSNQPTNPNQAQNFSQQPTNPNQAQNFSNQPANPNQPQNFSNQPTNPNQAQNFSNQPTNPNQAQNFSQQPTNPNQAQNFSNQPTNPNQPQNFSQQPANPNQPQNFSQQPTNQNQPQNFSQQSTNMNQAQNFSQQPTNQNQPQNFSQQPANPNQPQNFSQQPANPNQAQNFSQQPTNPNQAQNFSQQSTNMNQAQNFSQQPTNMNQAQNFSQQPTNQNQPQNFSQQPANPNQPQNFSQQPTNQNQAQNFSQQPTNTNQPQNFSQQPTNQNQAQNFSQQPTNPNQPQNFSQQPTNPNQAQNFSQQPTNPNQAQNFSSNQEISPDNRTLPRPKNVDDDFLDRYQEIKEQMAMAKSLMLKQPIQNDSEMMGALKNLAKFFMHRPETTARDAATLQNFINNSQQMMPQSEARHLQNLLRLCQQNVPVTVQQAAVQQNLPDLPRLWAFMQMCDMAKLTTLMNSKAFKRAGKDVSEFANSMRQAMGGDNSTVQNQRSFQMMLPLYMNNSETSYPTYLSVFDENEQDKETGENKKETWVRICVLTDNIGAVELIFRVYEENQLDMRFYFSQRDVAKEFRRYMDDLRNSLSETSFEIGEIRIGSVGERMEAS